MRPTVDKVTAQCRLFIDVDKSSGRMSEMKFMKRVLSANVGPSWCSLQGIRALIE